MMLITETVEYYKRKFFSLIYKDLAEDVDQRRRDRQIQRDQQQRDLEANRERPQQEQQQQQQQQRNFDLQRERLERDRQIQRDQQQRDLEANRGRPQQQQQQQPEPNSDERRARIENEVARERAAELGRPATGEDRPLDPDSFRYIDTGKKPEFTSNVRHTSELYGVDPYDLATSPQFQRQKDEFAALSPEDQKTAAEMFGDPRKPEYLDREIVKNTGVISAPKDHELSKSNRKIGGFASQGYRDEDGNEIAPGIYLNQNITDKDSTNRIISHEIAHTNQDFSNYDRNVPYWDKRIEQGAESIAQMKRIRQTLPNGAIDRPLTDDEANAALKATENTNYSTDELRNNPNLFNYFKNMVADKSTGKKASPNVNNNDAFA